MIQLVIMLLKTVSKKRRLRRIKAIRAHYRETLVHIIVRIDEIFGGALL